jgi:exopolyphosphatase / guanosine-5'-triphosphate,3'-diphosphate pyrophosphatase
MRIAVIDLGTNTFNLLIAENQDNQPYTILHSSKISVKLAKGSLDRKELKNDAITRGMNAIEKFTHIIHEMDVLTVHACATAAIRNAKNGNIFIKSIKDKFDIDVLILEGDKEAELTYQGVRQSVNLDQKALIVDIGGGSIEFVIADKDKIYWKKSHPIGVAHLLDKFHPSDPMSIEEIEYINNFFEEKLTDLFEEVRKHHVDTLIGASGAFESFGAMIREEEKFESEIGHKPVTSSIEIQEFDDLFWRLVNSTVKERKKMKGLEHSRLEFIVLASLVVKFLIDKLKFKNLLQTNFALKEGIMYEAMAEKIHTN